MDLEVMVENRLFNVKYSVQGETIQISIGDQQYVVDAQVLPDGFLSMLVNGRSHDVLMGKQNQSYDMVIQGESYDMIIDGECYQVELIDPRMGRLFLETEDEASSNRQDIYAPMTGQVTRVLVAEEDEVHEGDGLIILEAMKMENEIKSRGSGTVKQLSIQDGDIVSPGQILLVIE